eukprot:Skav234916  [mRNA]  locus=scaffold840:911202:911693:+ [translate_table: standard]
MMSFGEQLGQKAYDAQMEWVEQTLQKFMAKCEKAAAEQQEKACMREYLFSDEALKILQKRLDQLGFACQHTLRARSELVDGEWRRTVDIHAGWKIGPAAPEKTRIAPQGTKGNCPVCHENRPVVALVPCGHTVCQQCHESHQLRQCPMCRKHLTGATQALFVG